MARSIWTGAISFGLVTIPVKLYNAVSRKTVHFNQIDARTQARIKQKRVSAETGEEVPYEEIVKGYELGSGAYVIITDDGLQHYALHRDLEICVFDNRGCGNGWLLPAGPLRESWPRLALAQAGQSNERLLVLHTGTEPAFGGYRATRSLAPAGLLSDGTRIALNSLTYNEGKPLFAVAGIAQPQAFFDMLSALSIPLAGTLALPDHYDFHSVLRTSHESYRLICTEKDAQKLWQVAPDSIAVPLVQTAEPAFWIALNAAVDAQLLRQP